jgi:DNA-binding response OmpR family regulator
MRGGEMAEPKDKKILVVEDDESIVEFLKFGLEREGFCVDFARDGIFALRSVERIKPDLIILDMMLPGKSGYEIIKSLQANEYRDIPILVATGKFADESFKNMVKFEPNVKEYIEKPIKLQILLHGVHSLLRTVSPSEKKALERSRELDKKLNPEGTDNNF